MFTDGIDPLTLRIGPKVALVTAVPFRWGLLCGVEFRCTRPKAAPVRDNCDDVAGRQRVILSGNAPPFGFGGHFRLADFN